MNNKKSLILENVIWVLFGLSSLSFGLSKQNRFVTRIMSLHPKRFLFA